MGAYQYRRLAQDVTKAKKDVDETVGALISVIQKEYVGKLLDDEEKKLANPYKTFLSKHDSSEARLSLDQRWQADERMLEARRSSAQSAIAALQTLQRDLISWQTMQIRQGEGRFRLARSICE